MNIFKDIMKNSTSFDILKVSGKFNLLKSNVFII